MYSYLRDRLNDRNVIKSSLKRYFPPTPAVSWWRNGQNSGYKTDYLCYPDTIHYVFVIGKNLNLSRSFLVRFGKDNRRPERQNEAVYGWRPQRLVSKPIQVIKRV